MKTLKTKCGMEVTINPVEGVEARYANASVENRMKFAADMASVSFGRKASKKPEKRWREFFVEAAGNAHVSPRCSKCGAEMECKSIKETKCNIAFTEKCPKCMNEENRIIMRKISSKDGWHELYIFKHYPQDVMIEKGPSRPLENIPVKFYIEQYAPDKWSFYSNPYDKEQFYVSNSAEIFKLSKYANISMVGKGLYEVYTNLRNMINYGFEENEVFNEDIPEFVAFRVRAPYFAFAQVRTHSKLTQIAQSDRWSKEDEYWLPEDIEERFREKGIFDGTKDEILKYLLSLPPLKGQEELKRAGYHLEIYQRWPNHMKFKEWTISGFVNDPDSILHFLLQRKAYPEIIKDKTQEQTATIASMMRELLEWYMEERL